MRLKKIIVTLLLLFTLAFIMSMGLYALAGESEIPATITGHNVRFRAQNNTNSTILALMPLGTKVTVTGQIEDWYKVRLDGQDGFVFGEFVSIDAKDDGEPGYINAGTVRLRVGPSLDAAILTTMSRGTTLTITDTIGEWYAVTVDGVSGFAFAEFVTPGVKPAPAPRSSSSSAKTVATPARSAAGVETVDWWSEGKRMMRPGTRATLTDVKTGISFNIRVMSSGNHADVEPLTADDTAAMRRIRGGKWNWNPRASLLTVNGRTIAVSVNGMPHGGSTIRGNNFNGHFCMHFLNSRNHYNNRVDSGHKRQIEIALKS
jgi:SH3-like domain-containing protein